MNEIQTTPHNAVQLVDGVPMVDSRNIAAMFGKRHDHVLEVIRQEIEAAPTNLGRAPDFRETSYLDNQGKQRPAYLLTKMAAIAIAMSFTGERARQLRWAIVLKRIPRLEDGSQAMATMPNDRLK